jgi:glucoamylase
MTANDNPPGAPGIDPRWTRSDKDGIGTAYSSSSRLWFTLSHGIVNEIYYPYVDTPNTRDLQFLITDGESFCHEEKRDLDHRIEYPEPNALIFRIINSDRNGRYRITKVIIGEPHSSVLLMHTRVEILDSRLRGKLRLYALLAPHLKGTGRGNSARWCDTGGRRLMHADRADTHLVFGCTPDFTRRSIGYVGCSDGWQDITRHKAMAWEFGQAQDGNIALTGEVDLSQNQEFVIAIAFGGSAQSASSQLLQALATPFAQSRLRYVSQWQRTQDGIDLSAHTTDGGHLARISQCVLLAHEDKVFPGAFVASLSIPWGETKDDRESGGYHMVWTRDLVHSATALLACGRTESSLRALIWLACTQEPDGSVPQNSSIAGRPYWAGIQLDEVAMPILLAWRLRKAGALRDFDPWTLVARAASYLILHGPVTAQERWEENAGYSPSTLAAIIASLVCAADFARDQREAGTADFLLAHADWISSKLEQWTVTSHGELLDGKPRHYVRITPAIPGSSDGTADPDTAVLEVANHGGSHPARNVVSGDFLQLVRLGIRSAHDAVVKDSIVVIDHVLRRVLPKGPCWRRYNHDGYGQKEHGGAFDGSGVGRSWPILTGERGHLELAAGRDPMPFISALEGFANDGGMLSEQLWDEVERSGHMRFGKPTGAAMPLCWSHAEYLSLVRSHRDGACFDRVEPAYERYVTKPVTCHCEIWSSRHAISRIAVGRTLRIVLPADCTIVWSTDGWKTTHTTDTTAIGPLRIWYADIPTDASPAGTSIAFTFFDKSAQRWEGRDVMVSVS